MKSKESARESVDDDIVKYVKRVNNWAATFHDDAMDIQYPEGVEQTERVLQYITAKEKQAKELAGESRDACACLDALAEARACLAGGRDIEFRRNMLVAIRAHDAATIEKLVNDKKCHKNQITEARELARIKRQGIKAERDALIRRVVDDLYRVGKGHAMTPDAIVRHFRKNGIEFYKDSTLKGKINNLTKEMKDKYPVE